YYLAEAHLKVTRQFIAAHPAAAFAAWALLFAQTVFAQPVSESLGELLVGKAAFGVWRADAPLVRRKITELPPPNATRSASNPPRGIARPVAAAPRGPPCRWCARVSRSDCSSPISPIHAWSGSRRTATSSSPNQNRGGFGSCAPPTERPLRAAMTCSPQASISHSA